MPTISTLTVDVESKTSGFTKGLKIAVGGLATLAAGAAFAFGQFEESEKVAAQTDAVLKSTGNAAHTTADKISGLANELARKSGVDDEAIQTGENMILTFKNISNEAGKGNAIFNQTTKAVLDMSVAMGQDMKSSAIQVGKALNDPIAGMSALSRVGVTFSEQQKKQIEGFVKHNDLLSAQKVILAELTSEFGGSAAAQATASGKMSVALGNLAETVGRLLAPAFEFLAEQAQVVVAFLQDNAGPAFKAAIEWFKGLWEKVKPVAEIFGGALLQAATTIWHTFQENLLPALQRLWEAIKPLVIVLGVLVGAILLVAIKTLPVLFEALAVIIDVLAGVIDFVGDKFVGPVIRFFERIVDWVKDHWGNTFKAMVTTVGDIVGPIVGFIQRIIDVIKTLVGWAITAFHALEALNPFSGTAPAPGTAGKGAPGGGERLQHGGIVTSPRFALIGEAGPEAVIPLDRLGGFGTVINLTINGDVTGEEIVRKVRDGLLKLGARNATTGL